MNSVNTNKLINEKSPYLLQHVLNPVSWYPWSEEAFLKAKEEDKLIFLSIGYSTCHWCHVMAHESFEDEEVASFLNKNYISIKVDKEERPDIDSIYMNVCQKITGSGGWPLSIIIDSDKKPIYAGTYFPKRNLLQLLDKINYLWINNRESLEKNTLEIMKSIKENVKEQEEANVSMINRTFSLFTSYFDYTNGGLIGAPKFPTPHNWMFLMKYYQTTKNKTALDLVTKTLESMRKGGIYDHVGFGFCRYSTDKKWLVPHFEKMLYDNSLLIITYCHCYSITKKNIFLDTAKEVASYLIRKMQSPFGGFYTAEDADSEGEEGKFYTFTNEEIDNILDEDSKEYSRVYNITEKGNFEGKNIPNLIGKEISEKDNLEIEECRKKIFSYQQKRIPPLRDDKILTSFNGILIASFSLLGRVSNDDSYIIIAKEIADFIKNKMLVGNKLMARFKDNEVKYLGYDEDYAYTIMGLIELHQTTLDDKYLNFAIDLNEIFIKNFYDEENGGFYQTDKDGETILFRNKQIYDGATPSSNSVEIYNLQRLYNITMQERYKEIASDTINYFTSDVKEYPLGYSFYNMGLLNKIYGSTEITLVGEKIEDVKELLKVIHESNLGFYEVRFINDGSYKLKDNIPTAYVCKDKKCLPPINEIDKLSSILLNI